MWERIAIMDCDEAAPAKLHKARGSIADRASKLEVARTQFGEREERLKTAELTQQAIAEMDGLRASRLAIWQDELALRNDYEAWLNSYRLAIPEMEKAVRIEHEGAVLTIRRKLVEIGYVDCIPETEGKLGRIQPAMLLIHPTLRKLSDLLTGYESISSSISAHFRMNKESRQRTLESIQAFRSKLMATV